MVDFNSFSSFKSASRSVLQYLQKKIGFGLWMMTRVNGDDWIVLQVEDNHYGVQEGTVFNWCESFCSRMVKGEGPQIAPDSQKVLVYAQAEIGKRVEIGSYIGVPILNSDGSLFGTLCAIDPNPHDESIENELPLINLLGRLLSTMLLLDELNLEIKDNRDKILGQNSELIEQKELIHKKNVGLREMLHIVSHDVLNPINFISGILQLSKDDSTVLNHFKDDLTNATDSTIELINLVRQIGALDEGKLEVNLTKVNLYQALKESLNILRMLILKKEIQIINEVESSIEVLVDYNPFVHSVLNNILTNAIKFSEMKSIIMINSKTENGYIHLSIKDSGIGIPDDMLEKVFSLNKPTSRKGTMGEKGTGFGLPLVRKFVEKFNGKIKIESIEQPNPNHGTTVIISLLQ